MQEPHIFLRPKSYQDVPISFPSPRWEGHKQSCCPDRAGKSVQFWASIIGLSGPHTKHALSLSLYQQKGEHSKPQLTCLWWNLSLTPDLSCKGV